MNKIPFCDSFLGLHKIVVILTTVWNYYTGFSEPVALPGQKIVYTHARYDQLGRSKEVEQRDGRVFDF